MMTSNKLKLCIEEKTEKEIDDMRNAMMACKCYDCRKTLDIFQRRLV